MSLIQVSGRRLYACEVIPQPDVQPLVQRHAAWLHIRPVIDLRRDGSELLADFFLRLAVNRFLYLLSRLGINAEGVACLPASV